MGIQIYRIPESSPLYRVELVAHTPTKTISISCGGSQGIKIHPDWGILTANDARVLSKMLLLAADIQDKEIQIS